MCSSRAGWSIVATSSSRRPVVGWWCGLNERVTGCQRTTKRTCEWHSMRPRRPALRKRVLFSIGPRRIVAHISAEQRSEGNTQRREADDISPPTSQ